METQEINNCPLSVCSFLLPVRFIDLRGSEKRVNPKDLFPNLKLDGGEFSGYEFTELRSKRNFSTNRIEKGIGLCHAAFTPAKLAYFIARAARTLLRGPIGTIFLLDRGGEISQVRVMSSTIGLKFRFIETPIHKKSECIIYRKAIFVLPFKLEV